MGGCCVPTCKCRQRFKSGKYNKIGMFRFPQDLRRRVQWANLVMRPNWVPTDISRICEVNTIYVLCLILKVNVI